VVHVASLLAFIIYRNNNILLVSFAVLQKMSVIMVSGKIILATMGFFSKNGPQIKAKAIKTKKSQELNTYQQPFSYCDVSKSPIIIS